MCSRTASQTCSRTAVHEPFTNRSWTTVHEHCSRTVHEHPFTNILSRASFTNRSRTVHEPSTNRSTAHTCYFWGIKKPLRACYCSEMLFLRYEKTPAGMSLLRNIIFEVRKSPCGHATAQKCYFLCQKKRNCGHATAQKNYFLGTKKPLQACHCSEMPFFRYKKAPAGMLLLRNTIF